MMSDRGKYLVISARHQRRGSRSPTAKISTDCRRPGDHPPTPHPSRTKIHSAFTQQRAFNKEPSINLR